ncbi:hypothetical protein [Actinoplanes sp. RD1]|uniref:hypothetical protein n=1 Tax=Actinoplanes sp. RD1 TaxID=3064538 RepID=UPI002742793E|nr:hypothetical protein [Actinoplanes sp. RD1]
MTIDLTSTVKLLHRVFEFLATQSATQLSDLAAGRSTLTAVAAAAPVAEPAAPVAEPAPAGGSVVRAGGPVGGPARHPVPGPVPGAVPEAGADFSAIIAELRGQPSAADGTAYLNKLQLNGKKATKADLIAVAAAAGLTLQPATLKSDAVRKLVEHAIGTHRKYAGLSAW